MANAVYKSHFKHTSIYLIGLLIKELAITECGYFNNYVVYCHDMKVIHKFWFIENIFLIKLTMHGSIEFQTTIDVHMLLNTDCEQVLELKY